MTGAVHGAGFGTSLICATFPFSTNEELSACNELTFKLDIDWIDTCGGPGAPMATVSVNR